MERENRATAVGIEQVMNIWRSMNDGYPFFAVFYTRGSKYFQYNKDDLESAEEFLRNNLNAVADAGDNSMYYLNIYDESKKNYTNSGMVCAFPFRLNAYNPAAVSGPGTSADMASFVKALQDAHQKEIQLVKELSEAKYANQPLDTWDRIGGLMETPGVAQSIVPLVQPIIGALMGLINKATGTQPAQYQENHLGIAGTPIEGFDEKLDIQLDRLEKHGDLLELLTLLADFADKNPVMFAQYLNMLKAG